jgi:phosphate uptake regulator
MGGKTFVVSLPSEWVKKYEIHKGEELDLEIRGDSVVVRTEKFIQTDDLEVNMTKLRGMLGRAVGAIYKAGYNQAKIIYDSPEQLRTIEATLARTGMGFEIIKEEKNYVVVKNLVQTDAKEFDNSLRRLFYTLEVMGWDLAEAKTSEDLERVILKDDQVNRLADFCRRILNVGDTKFVFKPHVIYYVVEQLERIGDLYKKLARRMLKDSGLCDDDLREMFLKTQGFLVQFRELFYNFEMGKFENFGGTFSLFVSKLEALEDRDAFLVFNLRCLLETIFDMNGALLTVKI